MSDTVSRKNCEIGPKYIFIAGYVQFSDMNGKIMFLFYFRRKFCRSDGCIWISFLETNRMADTKFTATNYNHLSQYRLRKWLAKCSALDVVGIEIILRLRTERNSNPGRKNFPRLRTRSGARDGAVGWDTAPQTGSSRVRRYHWNF
jgi:hypothetical protein